MYKTKPCITGMKHTTWLYISPTHMSTQQALFPLFPCVFQSLLAPVGVPVFVVLWLVVLDQGGRLFVFAGLACFSCFVLGGSELLKSAQMCSNPCTIVCSGLSSRRITRIFNISTKSFTICRNSLCKFGRVLAVIGGIR